MSPEKKPKQAPPLMIRVDEKLREALEKLAEADRRPLSAYARIVLEDHVAKKVGK